MSVRAFLAAITMVMALIPAAACRGGDGAEGTTAPAAARTVVPTTERTVVPTAAPTPAPTTAQTVSPSPTPATGPLVVYTKQVRMTNAYLPRHAFEIDTYDIVTYDVGTHSRLSSFQVDKPPGPPSDITLVGDKIAVNLEERVVLYNLDGSRARELRAAPPRGSILGIAASPDGTKLALAEQTGRLPTPQSYSPQSYSEVTSLVFLEIASAQELLVVPQSAPGFATFRGQAGGITWRDDGSGIFVHGGTASEEPGGTATVLLDGSVQVHDLRGFVFVAPNGRYAAHGFDLGGMNVIGRDLILRDLDSEVDLASVHDDSLVFEPGEWSPDSTAYLYSTEATRPSSSPGPGWEYVEGSLQWHLLHVDGSPPSPVPDPEALRDQWYGAARPKLLCGDRVVLYAYCTDERGVAQAVDLYFGDIKVDSGMDIQILGYVQQPNM